MTKIERAGGLLIDWSKIVLNHANYIIRSPLSMFRNLMQCLQKLKN